MLKKGFSAFTEDSAISHLPISCEYRVKDFFPDVADVHIIEGRGELPDVAIVHEISIEDAGVTVGVGREGSG